MSDNMESKVLELLTSNVMRPGEIANALNIDKKEVDKHIKSLKAQDLIHSPKRCFYAAK